jgi:hypothetical protein
MPELKRLFTSGKMNKDLDERLVPNGQYRDAQNIQVSDSEGSDVGAIESVLGNTKRNKKSNSANDLWQANFGLTSPTCIGIARDTLNNKVYWFITSDSCDAILEYDESTEFIAPVLVDSGSILDFNKGNLITGVNVFEGLLAWTDDRNEPRIINIETFKSATTTTIGSGRTLSGVTTSVYGRSFLASDITVIKQKPKTAPTFTAASSTRTGVGSGLNTVTVEKDFTEPFNSVDVPLEVGSSVTFTTSADTNWLANDIVVLNASELNDNNNYNEYQVRIKVTSVTNSTVVGTIQSISSNLRAFPYVWTCVLEEEKPMFEFEFPRFAYRWKYKNNEYSAFSPFTKPVFVPGDFEYISLESHNVGMVNNLRKLTINGFETPPKDVDEVEILYKDSSSNNIYKVDEIAATETSYSITSELIYHVVQSNQILRPYDNVPLKAKAQELIGNRLVYGNYVQNYEIDTETKISLAIDSSDITSVKTPESSLKSLRTYQVGIVYLDENGRETPVFTNDTASIRVDKNVSHKVNKLKVDFDNSSNAAPSWATHFKYFVKETSTPYYNFVLDRYYASEDGNVWLSIPSAERNKIEEGQYIEIKKKHNSDEPVEGNARYKVLDIKNEVPDFVKTKRKFIAVSSITRGQSSDPGDRIASGLKDIHFIGPDQTENESFFQAFKQSVYIRFKYGNNTSAFYEVQSGGYLNNTTTGQYQVVLKEKISDVDDFMDSLGYNVEITCEIHEKIIDNLPEFQGRFFVKINRDVIFEENIIYNFTNDPSDYEMILNTQVLVNDNIVDNPDSDLVAADGFGWAENTNAPDPSVTVHGKPTTGSKLFGFYFAPYDGTLDNETTAKAFNDNIDGGVVQFYDSTSGTWSGLYEVDSVVDGSYDRQSGTVNSADDETGYYWNVTLKDQFRGDIDFDFEAFDISRVKIVKRRRQLLSEFDENSVVLSSFNPAVFETEPRESADLEIYYEASDAIAIANIATEQTLTYTNCFSFGNGVESDRIRDDFNAPTIGKGVKASSTLDEPYSQERKGAGMIYSGIFNSTSGVNQLNQFIAAEKITKDLNPIYGTIQKMHARDTDLIVLLEDKIFRILANKDALYNADGNANLTATNRVLGQATPYVGEYGISKNPESFASYGFRAYFTDKARGAVIRLSRDGITEISSKGMSDYILDAYKAHNIDQIYGSYDEDAGAYNVRLNGEVLSFKENVDGWATRLSYEPEGGISLNNEYYTFDNGEIYIHNNTTRSNFYGTQYDTTVTLLHNDQPSRIKNFKTLSYEGDSGWTATVDTDQQDGEVATWKNKEGIYYNYIRGLDSTWNSSSQSGTLDTSEFNVQGIDNASTATLNADQTVWTIRFANDINVSLQGWVDGAEESDDKVYFVDDSDNDKVYLIGTCRDITGNEIKVNKDTNAVPAAGDFIFFAKNTQVNTSGIIGYYASVKMTKTGGTNKELFAVNSEIFISS